MKGLLAAWHSITDGAKRLASDPQLRGLLFLVCLIISVGTVFYRWVEGLSWVDSFYFVVTTLTTVGYGDIVPVTTAGKLFAVMYLLIGIGFFAAFVSNFVNHMIEARSEQLERLKEKNSKPKD